MNSPVLGWALAVVAVAAGYIGYGWPGVLLAVSVVVFWLLLQFSRAMRLMRMAAQQPIGSVKSALMLHTRMQSGLRLADVMKMTGSFGAVVKPNAAGGAAPDTETYTWADDGGDTLQVTLRAGKVSSWLLQRAEAAAPAHPDPEPGA